MRSNSKQTYQPYPKHYTKGCIYIATSPALRSGLYKVGYSKDPRRRMKELTEQSATALPLPYGALFIHETQNMALAEEIAHDTLDRYRINPYREFFEVDLQLAKLVVSRACQIADGIDVEMPTVPRIEKLSPPPEPMPISSPAAPITTPDIDSHIKNYLLVIFTLARIARSSLIWLLSCCWLLVIHKYGFTKPSAWSTVGLPLVYLFVTMRIESLLRRVREEK